MSCPPCIGNCDQGRKCPSRTEIDLMPALVSVAVIFAIAVLTLLVMAVS
jgi:hypothetical protein